MTSYRVLKNFSARHEEFAAGTVTDFAQWLGVNTIDRASPTGAVITDPVVIAGCDAGRLEERGFVQHVRQGYGSCVCRAIPKGVNKRGPRYNEARVDALRAEVLLLQDAKRGFVVHLAQR